MQPGVGVEVQLLILDSLTVYKLLVLPGAVQHHVAGEALDQPSLLSVNSHAMVERGVDEPGPGMKPLLARKSSWIPLTVYRTPKVRPVRMNWRGPERRGLGDAVAAGPASGQLELRAVDSAEHEPGIGPGHPVVVGALDLVGVHHAQPGLGADIALDPEQVIDRMIVAGRRPGLIVHRAQQSEIGTQRLAGELGRRDRLDDPPGVDQVVRGGELLDAIEKEGPLLVEEELVSRIEEKLG